MLIELAGKSVSHSGAGISAKCAKRSWLASAIGQNDAALKKQVPTVRVALVAVVPNAARVNSAWSVRMVFDNPAWLNNGVH